MRDWGKDTLIEGCQILRIHKFNPEKVKIAPKQCPEHVFVLSDSDKQEGEDRNLQPVLSVWDKNADLDDLKIIRGIQEPHFAGPYSLCVDEVNCIETEETRTPVSVHSDPILDCGDCEITERNKDLHYGIQGLFRPPDDKSKKTKAYFKNLRFELARLAKLV